ncbi:DUF1566 domain-containing protein [Methylomonas koyamae]|uniref:DUF1566 domain-containing protein n=1 Tax=Methylomonas koyamae TaxID=702114 RepID=UPI000AACC9D8|nr:DUF1566 domain-containing protein [Methylomonas koyamae]BBL58334.1 hypothetical protein MKFW12EY_19470 [Methylomonas koyamae]
MKEQNNSIIKLFIVFLALSAASLTALARDSLEALRNDLNTETTYRTNSDNNLRNLIYGESVVNSNVHNNLQNQISDINRRQHYVGDFYAGGRIFYVDDTGQHGLIAALNDYGALATWHNRVDKTTGTSGDGVYAGEMNTAILVAMQISDYPGGNFAAKFAADYSRREDGDLCFGEYGEICYGDWYLPSKAELSLLYQQKNIVGSFSDGFYWSSNDSGDHTAWSLNFANGSLVSNGKAATCKLRFVRAF